MVEHELKYASHTIYCAICFGAGYSLPTDCPGVTMSPDQIDAVRRGTLDYKDGKWYNPQKFSLGSVASSSSAGSSTGEVDPCRSPRANLECGQ